MSLACVSMICTKGGGGEGKSRGGGVFMPLYHAAGYLLTYLVSPDPSSLFESRQKVCAKFEVRFFFLFFFTISLRIH